MCLVPLAHWHKTHTHTQGLSVRALSCLPLSRVEEAMLEVGRGRAPPHLQHGRQGGGTWSPSPLPPPTSIRGIVDALSLIAFGAHNTLEPVCLVPLAHWHTGTLAHLCLFNTLVCLWHTSERAGLSLSHRHITYREGEELHNTIQYTHTHHTLTNCSRGKKHSPMVCIAGRPCHKYDCYKNVSIFQ